MRSHCLYVFVPGSVFLSWLVLVFHVFLPILPSALKLPSLEIAAREIERNTNGVSCCEQLKCFKHHVAIFPKALTRAHLAPILKTKIALRQTLLPARGNVRRGLGASFASCQHVIAPLFVQTHVAPHRSDALPAPCSSPGTPVQIGEACQYVKTCIYNI